MSWVEAYARKQNIPIEWAGKGVRKEDDVRPRLRQMERHNRFGVYFILKSMIERSCELGLLPEGRRDHRWFRIAS